MDTNQHQDLRGKPYTGKTTGGNGQRIYYDDGKVQNWYQSDMLRIRDRYKREIKWSQSYILRGRDQL